MKVYQFLGLFMMSILMLFLVSCSADDDGYDTETATLEEPIEQRKRDYDGPGPVRETLAYHFDAACFGEGTGKHKVSQYFKTYEECTCFKRIWGGTNCTIYEAGSYVIYSDCLRAGYSGYLYNYLCP